MQYEAIILELLSRIKRLEDEVAELKQSITIPDRSSAVSQENDEPKGELNVSLTSRQKTTDEMIEICYKCGKKLCSGENIHALANSIVEETGMNRNSAIMYLHAVQGMLKGTTYSRAISSRATKIFLTNIFNEYGSDGLNKAINAVKQHIIFRQACGLPSESVEEICNTFESKL